MAKTVKALSKQETASASSSKVMKVVLATLVVVVEVILVGITTLVIEETSGGEVALVAVKVVVDMVVSGMTIADLVMMEETLEVVEAIILAITMINLQILDPYGRNYGQKLWPVVLVETNTLSNHETKVALAVPAASRAMEVEEGFNYCQEKSSTGEESQRSDSEAIHYNRFVNAVTHSGDRAHCYKEDMFSTILVCMSKKLEDFVTNV